MKRHLNTLYVTTQGARLAKVGQTVVVRVEGHTRLQLPVHNLGSIVCLGRIFVSQWLMAYCAENAVAISFLTEHGRFLARVQGATTGNVVLRRQQYRSTDDARVAAMMARSIVIAKLANSRAVLLRAVRDGHDEAAAARVAGVAKAMSGRIEELRGETDLERVRGSEGLGARLYFSVFDDLIVQQKGAFTFRDRSKRPPRDPVNAALSFVYTLLVHDIRGALEAVGLDPAVGFLHRDRPGRPSLALDILEEFRAFLADRLVLSLINLRQLTPDNFRVDASGAVLLDDEGRKTVLTAYQKRKQEELVHPFLVEKTTVGLLPHLQALLLSRWLRGDLDGYPPFIMK